MVVQFYIVCEGRRIYVMSLFEDEDGAFQISYGDDPAGAAGAGDLYDDRDDGGDGRVSFSFQFSVFRGKRKSRSEMGGGAAHGVRIHSGGGSGR